MSTRDQKILFKHLKSLNESLSFPKVIIKDGKSDSHNNRKFSLLIKFFHSICSPKENLKVKHTKPEILNLTNFCVSRKKVYQFLIKFHVTKSWKTVERIIQFQPVS